jgi:hypothetical protein
MSISNFNTRGTDIRRKEKKKIYLHNNALMTIVLLDYTDIKIAVLIVSYPYLILMFK